ncbi:MAG: SxtJ family membrane protein [Cyclobacteriaceae bacterium]
MDAREKETVITIMVGCLILYAFFWAEWLWLAALGLGLAAMVSDKITHWVHVAWFWIGEKVGYVMPKIILGILFLLILLPLALIAKLFRGDFMLLKDSYPSYFIERPHVYERRDLENPW